MSGPSEMLPPVPPAPTLDMPPSVPSGMRLELSRARLLPGAGGEAERWMQMLHDRYEECLDTLSNERMALEATFRHTDPDGTEWLYHFSLYGEGGSGLDLSNPVDREHQEYAVRCKEPGWEELRPVLLLAPRPILPLLESWARDGRLPEPSMAKPQEGTMRDHDERNRASRERLESITTRLDETALRRPMGEHWTVAIGLLHLAFWDRFVVERWRHADAAGTLLPADIEEHAEDIANETLTDLLSSIPVDEAPRRALEAALRAEQAIAALSDERVAAVAREGRPRLIDRSIHRAEHLDEIEDAIG